MRDEFGEVDPDEVDIIDIFDPDADVFGAESGEAPFLAPYRRPRWVMPTAVAGVVAIAVSGFLVWAPWSGNATTSFGSGDAPELTLTERLVFDDPPAELAGSELGEPSSNAFFGGFEDAEGYFFAEPGVTADFFSGESTGRWAAFFAVPESEDDLDVPDGPQTIVQGVPARISTNDNEQQIEFGPVNGQMFSVVTSGMPLTESLEFANAVSVENGTPTVTRGALGDMQPIGDVADYTTVLTTLFATTDFGSQPGVVLVQYGEVTIDDEGDVGLLYALATQPVVSDRTLGMLHFLFGETASAVVHGQPAVVVDQTDEISEAAFVIWVEGGRIIVVIGPSDATSILELAESVRPATDDEWAEVEAVERTSGFDDFPVEPPDQSIALYESADGSEVLTAQFDDGLLSVCTERRADDGMSASCNSMNLEPPILAQHTSQDGKRFVVAIVSRDVIEPAELRITLADGTVETLPMRDVSNQLPGPATAAPLPDDHGPIELWVGDKLIKTLTV